ncbi:hypothetical protein APR04_003814 [Promicromonospora umidemergens]|uniref:Helix-turn-helix protein n=1 Tax=Promicromonospora umidemergens TaxID=629679 RepID=A0ABP8XGA4_9MICO|nr:helix-turn-helix domain-containing protein [Promicromonospora umidemergens]MCP2284891.1 hypothetical protein [Promicromonospora umidemergens]
MSHMPAGELRVIREWLGLSTVTLARLLEVRPDSVRRWETGRERVPERVRQEIESIEAVTTDAVGQLITELESARDAVVVVYRDTEDMPADRPDVARFGAPWWRHVVARAVHDVPGVVVCYPDEVEGLPDDTRGLKGTTLDQAREDFRSGTDLPAVIELHRHLGVPCTRVWIAQDGEVEGGSWEGPLGDVVQAANLAEWLEGLADDDPDDDPDGDPDAARELARRIVAGEDTWDGGPAGEMALRVTVLWRDVTDRD